MFLEFIHCLLQGLRLFTSMLLANAQCIIYNIHVSILQYGCNWITNVLHFLYKFRHRAPYTHTILIFIIIFSPRVMMITKSTSSEFIVYAYTVYKLKACR